MALIDFVSEIRGSVENEMITVCINSLLFNGISGVQEPKDLGWLMRKPTCYGGFLLLLKSYIKKIFQFLFIFSILSLV
jgi:hypothetical protein